VIARHLNLEVIAEGVETEYQFNYLKEKGCQHYQGYYFFHPLSVNQLEQTFMCQKR
jgi:EAL domain-containing protein (putative c-di-GMP-specific phosphodiesterase class I)